MLKGKIGGKGVADVEEFIRSETFKEMLIHKPFV